MPSSIAVAKLILAQSNEEAGDLVSNLKLQKLVYYAQGFHLAVYDEALFTDYIEAWTHGPVVPNVYHHYKQFGSGSIPAPIDFNLEAFSPEQVELLNEVQHIYGQYAAWPLRAMTHEESPSRNNYPAGALRREIPADDMPQFFKTLVK
ncbi:Panacea domain-containing protein [Pseudomonas aeruginosa]|uniref:Panacea domain-containing protein n=1 Tax=Pseudomonas aeruginosa TaxID=287 RepID=UPI000B43C7E7|nr:type II toxin-antitoxin system antitoxin SocA domain-containing protein [Pseudomonas aeruginosa]OTJ82543.1 hypothetical protein CAZ01_08770 [Pseudomonas aeruginosa]